MNFKVKVLSKAMIQPDIEKYVSYELTSACSDRNNVRVGWFLDKRCPVRSKKVDVHLLMFVLILELCPENISPTPFAKYFDVELNMVRFGVRCNRKRMPSPINRPST